MRFLQQKELTYNFVNMKYTWSTKRNVAEIVIGVKSRYRVKRRIDFIEYMTTYIFNQRDLPHNRISISFYTIHDM